jgi:hypothetical protein
VVVSFPGQATDGDTSVTAATGASNVGTTAVTDARTAASQASAQDRAQPVAAILLGAGLSVYRLTTSSVTVRASPVPWAVSMP